MRTAKDLPGIRDELLGILSACESPRPDPHWQLSDWCITMQSIIDIEYQLSDLSPACQSLEP